MVHVREEHLVVLLGQVELAELSEVAVLLASNDNAVAVPAAAAAVFHCGNPPLFRLLYEKQRKRE